MPKKKRKQVIRSKPAFGESALRPTVSKSGRRRKAGKKKKLLAQSGPVVIPAPKTRRFKALLEATDAKSVRTKEAMIRRLAAQRRRGTRAVRAIVISGGAIETNRRKH